MAPRPRTGQQALRPRIYLLCGRTGSGKTTYARKLEDAGAMAFSTDDWMIRLFGHHMPRELFTQRLIVCETMVLELALKLAARGVDTVIDHGFWRRESRDSARAFLARAQADVVLVYFDVPTSVLKERLRARNTDLPEGTFEITEEMFEQFSTWFEAPGPDEGAVIVRSTS